MNFQEVKNQLSKNYNLDEVGVWVIAVQVEAGDDFDFQIFDSSLSVTDVLTEMDSELVEDYFFGFVGLNFEKYQSLDSWKAEFDEYVS